MKQHMVDLAELDRFRDAIRGLTADALGQPVTIVRDPADPTTVLVHNGAGQPVGILPRRGKLCKAILAGARIGHASWQGIGEPGADGCPSKLRVRVVIVDEGEHYEHPPVAPPRTYQVGIVGESNYQPAIRRCSPGQQVQIVREQGNPHDRQALAVVTSSGATIGYIPRDHWLQRAVHDEGKGCDATIRRISSGGAGSLGVVLDVALNSRGLGTRSFNRPPVAGSPLTPSATSSSQAVASGLKGWLTRLFR